MTDASQSLAKYVQAVNAALANLRKNPADAAAYESAKKAADDYFAADAKYGLIMEMNGFVFERWNAQVGSVMGGMVEGRVLSSGELASFARAWSPSMISKGGKTKYITKEGQPISQTPAGQGGK